MASGSVAGTIVDIGSIVGTIVDKETTSDVQWIVPCGHLSGTWQEDEYLQSPPFHFLRSSWNIRFYPNPHGSLVCLVRDDITNQKFPLTLHVRFDIDLKKYELTDDSQLYTFYRCYQICERTWKDFEPLRNEKSVFSLLRTGNADMKINCSVTEDHPQTMDMSSFCTREFSNDFGNLLRGQRSDIKIEAEGMTFPAHKLILKALSPAFAAMFEHQMNEQKEGVLDFKKYADHTVQQFLTFLYTGKLKSCDSYQSAKCLYEMANTYEVKDLKIRSRQLIEEKMSEDTVCDILNLANTDSILMESAKRFVKRYFFQVLPSRQWGMFKVKNKSLAKEIEDELFSSP